MKRLLVTNTDGSVTVILPVSKKVLEGELGPLTDAEYEATIVNTSLLDTDTEYEWIEESRIPVSREFRDSWRKGAGKVSIDCNKAKECAIEDVRRSRHSALVDNDQEFLISFRRGRSTLLVDSKKKTLLDSTEYLKGLNCSGKFDNEELLGGIREGLAKALNVVRQPQPTSSNDVLLDQITSQVDALLNSVMNTRELVMVSSTAVSLMKEGSESSLNKLDQLELVLNWFKDVRAQEKLYKDAVIGGTLTDASNLTWPPYPPEGFDSVVLNEILGREAG